MTKVEMRMDSFSVELGKVYISEWKISAKGGR
jgi:hypothetical protein